MRLADDDRGRVPFAIVGVVLLVASATFAAGVSTRESGGAESGAALAVEEATAAARTALHEAAALASRAAARRPVVDPANTTYGRAINESTPFRDALRVRTYARARAALNQTSASVRGVTASVSLPRVTDAASLRAAKRRVRVEPRRGGRRLAVTVRDLTVTVRRDGRVIAREQYAASLVVRTPVLALHRNVTLFERRLNAPPTRRGLASRLTARLYALAWVRGYAQYSGVPIANVVANRHVALATNGGLLDVQRAVFGRSDRVGRQELWRETKRASVAAVLGSAGEAAAGQTRPPAQRRSRPGTGPATVPRVACETMARELADAPISVGVNRSADRAFLDFVDDDLSGVVDEVYSTDVRLEVDVRTVEIERRNATRRDRGRRLTDWRLTPIDRVAPEQPPEGSEVIASFARNATRRTVVRLPGRDAVRVVTKRVVVSVVAKYATTRYAPTRDIAAPRQPGGPLDGRNFAGVRETALRRLVEERGGRGTVVRRALNGTLAGGRVTVRAPRPEGLRDWVYRDLVAVRDRVRNVSAETSRAAVVDGNPPAALAERLAGRRPNLVDAPYRYGSVAAKARVAARAAYLDTVQHRVDERASNHRSVSSHLRGRLAGVNVSAALAGVDREPAASRGVATRVRGTPAYLSLAETDSGRHPLVARNRNVFAVQYASVANKVAEAVTRGSGDSVRLRTAARALRAANRTLDRTTNATLSRRRSRLGREVSNATADVGDRVVEALRDRPSMSRADAEAAVETGLTRWDTAHERALAAANGSLARAVADAADAHVAADYASADRTAIEVRLAAARGVTDAGVDEAAVAPAVNHTRSVRRRVVASVVEEVGTRAGDRLKRHTSLRAATVAGLPVSPLLGNWYATTNVWTVTVRGEYARFEVAAPAGSPAPRPNVTYVRRSAPVAVDVDDDGDADRLGYDRPVGFNVTTAVAVVVPPGRSGVGDVDGTAIEESPGWPTPGSSDNGYARPATTSRHALRGGH